MRDGLANLRRLAVPYLVVCLVWMIVYGFITGAEWTTQRIAVTAVAWLAATVVLSLSYLLLRPPSSNKLELPNTVWLLREEAKAWRRYARQQRSTAGEGASLTREQLRELQDQHLDAFEYVLMTRKTIEQYSPAPAGSPTAEYDEGLRMAAIELSTAAMRFRGELTGGPSGDELSQLRALVTDPWVIAFPGVWVGGRRG